ncbi:MAG: hypothetical protein ACREI9_14285 [Nitrospiraceae bacterium]
MMTPKHEDGSAAQALEFFQEQVAGNINAELTELLRNVYNFYVSGARGRMQAFARVTLKNGNTLTLIGGIE